MAAVTKSNEDESDEIRDLEKEIGECRSRKKTLFEKARSVNDELESVAQLERESVDKMHRLIAEKHDREKQQQVVQRLIELEAELKHLKTENQTLKRELSEVHLETRPESVDTRSNVVRELQKQLNQTTKLLNKTTEELSGTRQRLSDVQERLTVAEQVTAATQQRELQESGNSEELQLELTLQDQSRTRTGAIWIYCKVFRFNKIDKSFE